MGLQLSEKKVDVSEQLSYLGLPTTMQRQQVAQGAEAPDDDAGATKKKGSALPLLVGAAAVVFLMAKK